MRYATILLAAILASPSFAATYYVDAATGNNADDGLSEANAWADPGYAAQQMGDSDICYVKAGTYTITTVTPGAGGPVKFAQASLKATMEGYSTTPGDRCVGGSKPVISADASLNPASTCYLVEGVGSSINEPHVFIALRVDANSEPNTVCFKGGSSATNSVTWFIECEGVEAASHGFETSHTCRCYAGSNGGNGFHNCACSYCYAESNTGVGITCLRSAVHCIARANGGGGMSAEYGLNAYSCVAHGNTGYGFKTFRNNTFINCVAVSNTDDGFETLDHSSLYNCADYGNTAGRVATTPMLDIDPVTLSGDPFVDAANDDFTPDNTANEGGLLRAAGINPYGHSGYADLGAVQHEDAGGGGGLAVDPIQTP